MKNHQSSTLGRLLSSPTTHAEVSNLLDTLLLPTSLLAARGNTVSRAVLAAALNLSLFRDLLERVPSGREYVGDAVRKGRPILFDHGAVRTVALAGMGALPRGELAITRILEPLGYRLHGVYPLDRLGMTGRSYAHQDLPEELPQFFVSELHPERFSTEFQAAVVRVTGTSLDPLSATDLHTLERLAVTGHLSLAAAGQLLPALLVGFRRQHATPALGDYHTLLAESDEMAWIATEGNAFNHATDRVADMDRLVAEQKALGRPLKDTIEVSRTGRVKQTAFKADRVLREFLDETGKAVYRDVPGSFYEFIQRERFEDAATGVSKLDLAFDAGNAQAIFRMTAAA